MPYIEGFVAAVPTANKEAYRKHAQEAVTYFKKLGATRLVECWGDDVPKGALTDFYKATQAKDDETPVFSWIEYPDKATRDAANKKMREDPSMANMEMPFDGKRMFWGGFEQIVNESRLGRVRRMQAPLLHFPSTCSGTSPLASAGKRFLSRKGRERRAHTSNALAATDPRSAYREALFMTYQALSAPRARNSACRRGLR